MCHFTKEVLAHPSCHLAPSMIRARARLSKPGKAEEIELASGLSSSLQNQSFECKQIKSSAPEQLSPQSVSNKVKTHGQPTMCADCLRQRGGWKVNDKAGSCPPEGPC